MNKNGNLMFRRVGRSLVAMRPPHPDPDQAPLTACTGRVSHDRTIEHAIESQLRIGPILSRPTSGHRRDGKRNEATGCRAKPARNRRSVRSNP